MSHTALVLFLTTSLVLILVPGPDMIYVVTRGVAQGRKAGLISAAGVCTGICVHTTFAALGLSAVLARSAVAFSAVKYAGAAYLIYLGAKALLGREVLAAPEESTSVPRVGSLKLYRQGVVSNILNPKVALFFLAFLPQFVNRSGESVRIQMLLLGLAFALITQAVLTSVALFSGTIGQWMRRKPGVARTVSRITGGVLVALGLRLALPERG